MANVKLPNKSKLNEIQKQQGKREKEIRYFTREQVSAIQDVIYNGYYPTSISRSGNTYASKDKKYIYQAKVFDLLLQTGLRVSELCALTYDNWNREENTLTIQSNRLLAYERDEITHERKGKKIARNSDTKTTESKATISLTMGATEVLKKLLQEEPDGYNGYIVHNNKGKPITRDILRGRWHRLLCAAGIEHKEQIQKIVEDKNGNSYIKKTTKIIEEYGIHTTRHTFASFLYSETKDISLVAKRLRHSDPAFTARIYVDILKSDEKKVDETFRV